MGRTAISVSPLLRTTVTVTVLVDAAFVEQAKQIVDAGNRLAVETNEQIAGLQPGRCRPGYPACTSRMRTALACDRPAR